MGTVSCYRCAGKILNASDAQVVWWYKPGTNQVVNVYIIHSSNSKMWCSDLEDFCPNVPKQALEHRQFKYFLADIMKQFDMTRATGLGEAIDAFASPPLTNIITPQPAISIGVGLRFRILKRDNYRCQICGRSAHDGVTLEVDHKIPRSKGGSSKPENLWCLCWDCNRGKSDIDL